METSDVSLKKSSNYDEHDQSDKNEGIVHIIDTPRARFKKYFEFGSNVQQQQRRLLSRHMLMLSIGGAIGTGIFLSSGQAISVAGPGSALFAYLFSGAFIAAVILLLGEVCAAVPTSGAYGAFGTRFINRPMGFALGMNYYFQWSLTIPADATASAIILQFWLPHVPSWVWAIAIIVPIFFLQLVNVRAYGEVEYWSALVKVVLVLLFISVGLLYDWGAIPKSRLRESSPGLSNWKNNQAFIGGFTAFTQALVYAFYSYSGAELVALTSGEASNPKKTIPKAIRLTSLRILLFNIFTVVVVGLCINHSDPRLVKSAENSDVSQSPIIVIFNNAGFPRAFVHVVNAIILTAVISALNSAYYASTRIMMTMSRLKLGPSYLGKVNGNGVPVVAVINTLIISCLAFLTTVWGAGVVFSWLQNLISISVVIAMISTGFISIRFRQALKAQGKSEHDLPFKQPFYPVVPLFCIFVGFFFFATQGYASAKADGPLYRNILGTYLGVVLFIAFYVFYTIKYPEYRKLIPPSQCELIPGSIWDIELQKVLQISEDSDEINPDKIGPIKPSKNNLVRRAWRKFRRAVDNI